MKTRTLTSIAAMILSAGTLAVPVQGVAQNRPVLYTVVDLGTLGGSGATPTTINDRGWVVGGSNLSGDQSGHGFLWRDGAMIDLGTLAGPNSYAITAKNNRGLIAGAAETASADPLAENPPFCPLAALNSPQTAPTGLICRGFVWRDGKMTALPTLGGNNGEASAANNQGQVVGFAEKSTNAQCPNLPLDYEAAVWGPRAGEIQTLPPLPGDKVSFGLAINASGLVAGASGPCISADYVATGVFPPHGVIWERGQATNLGSLGGTIVLPAEINSRGQVVGTSTLQGDTVFHAFLWQKGVMTDLGALFVGGSSIAGGINDQGEVVGGTSFGTSGVPFLWQNGAMTDLSTRIKPGSTSLTIFFANDINSRGEIAAQGFDPSNGEFRAVLLIPCNAQHADNKGCAGSAGAAAVLAVNTARPPWPVLPEQVRAQLQRRFAFGR